MTTTAETQTWRDMTICIDGVPVPGVAVVTERTETGPGYGWTGPLSVEWSFTCTDEAGPFLRRLARRCSVAVRNQRRVGQGKKRAARRRQRGRERADRIRVVREAHAAGLSLPIGEWRFVVGWVDILAGDAPRRFGRRARGTLSAREGRG